MSIAGTERWSDAFLDEMRETTDPPADAVVRELFDDGDVDAVNRLMQVLVRGTDVPREELPAVARAYFDETDDLPGWLDPELVRRGEEMFGEHGPTAVLVLLCSSLPTSYGAARGVQVLARTGQLHTHVFRRVVETAQLVVDVMAPGGLTPGGTGIRTAQKVRLMHAAVRLLNDRSGTWDPAWGRPINQEDIAGTLLCFSRRTVEGLRTLGVTVSDDDEAAYLHAWNAVGHVLGLDPRLMAWTSADADLLLHTILRRQWHWTPEGQAMNEAQIGLLVDLLPGSLLDGLPNAIMHELLGPDGAAVVGLAPAGWTSQLLGPAWALTRARDAVHENLHVGVPGLDHLHAAISQWLIGRLVWTAAGGERVRFRIPETLAQRWGVTPTPA